MKLFYTCIVIALLFACKSNHTFTTKKEGSDIILNGFVERKYLNNPKLFPWFYYGYQAYQPKDSIISILKEDSSKLSFLIFAGSWCGDTQKELPAFYKVADKMGYHYASNLIEKTKQSMNGVCGGIDLKHSLTHRISNESKLRYHHPDLQLHVRVFRLNNVDTFGYSIALFPQVEIPILKNNKLCLAAKMGYGINFNTKEFNSFKNFDNRAISSPLNFALDAGLLLQYKMNNKNEIGLSSGLYHVSNGSLKMPNGGINIVYTGFQYHHYLYNALELKYQSINY